MDTDDRLRLDYDQTAQRLRAIDEVRFKLLAFVPTVAGVSVGLLGGPRPAAELVGVGVIGLVATLGIFAFDLRNARLYRALLTRARALEPRLGLESIAGRPGPFSVIAGAGTHESVLRVLDRSHGLELVYAAAIGGWVYLVAWGGLKAIGVGEPRSVGAVLGVVAGAALAVAAARASQEDARPTS